MIIDLRCPKCNRPLIGSEAVVVRDRPTRFLSRMKVPRCRNCKTWVRKVRLQDDLDCPLIAFYPTAANTSLLTTLER